MTHLPSSLANFISSDDSLSSLAIKPVAYEFRASRLPKAALCSPTNDYQLSEEAVEEFMSSSSLFFSSACNTSASVVRDSYDINWVSPKDYLKNHALLSHDARKLLYKLVTSDTASNANRYGLKQKNLETHLLLHIGADANNILNSSRCSVVSNLKLKDSISPYSRECVDNRALDAKTCLRSANKYIRTYSTETLFKKGFVCYQAVVTSDSSYRSLKDFDKDKKRTHQFFRENAEAFALLARKKKIFSYVYSHEVSVDSILREEYRPHSHIIFFLPKSYSDSDALLFEEEFNSMFADRSAEVLRTEKDQEMVPKRVSSYTGIEKALNYLHNCYSLAPSYMREVRETNIRELNKKTVEVLRALDRLFKPEEGLDYRPVRRFNASHIPLKGEEESFKHPLLQKSKKSNRIKKVISSKNISANNATKPKHPSTAKESPVRDAESRAASTSGGGSQQDAREKRSNGSRLSLHLSAPSTRSSSAPKRSTISSRAGKRQTSAKSDSSKQSESDDGYQPASSNRAASAKSSCGSWTSYSRLSRGCSIRTRKHKYSSSLSSTRTESRLRTSQSKSSQNKSKPRGRGPHRQHTIHKSPKDTVRRQLPRADAERSKTVDRGLSRYEPRKPKPNEAEQPYAT